MMISKKAQQLGSSMIETLIALFLLAIGLLGALSLQVNSLDSNQRALFASEALLIGNDMVDQMYAIRDAAYSGLDTLAEINAATGTLESELGALKTVDAGDAAPGCTAPNSSCDLAGQVDVANYRWKTSLSERLPSGQGTISENAGVYSVTVYWDDAKTGATGLDCGNDPAVDLRCFSMEVQL